MSKDAKMVTNHPFFSIHLKRNPTNRIVEIIKPRCSKIKIQINRLDKGQDKALQLGFLFLLLGSICFIKPNILNEHHYS